MLDWSFTTVAAAASLSLSLLIKMMTEMSKIYRFLTYGTLRFQQSRKVHFAPVWLIHDDDSNTEYY
ncbi:MAG TPA: hypothetical protein VEH06_12005 [Candidatus Bathyarchaeia archaeon]|nr:hypothetical protein [Candidatus Bathyarchaeia archaeon]